jgi:hypothetical protein
VFRRDAGKQAAQTQSPFVINLDDPSGPGTHWTAARRVGATLFYADPFGLVLGGYPPEELQAMAKEKGWRTVVNRISWQRPSTNYCGYYAYLFTKGLAQLSPTDGVDQLEARLKGAVAGSE